MIKNEIKELAEPATDYKPEFESKKGKGKKWIRHTKF
jgi:hypothetical protein